MTKLADNISSTPIQDFIGPDLASNSFPVRAAQGPSASPVMVELEAYGATVPLMRPGTFWHTSSNPQPFEYVAPDTIDQQHTSFPSIAGQITSGINAKVYSTFPGIRVDLPGQDSVAAGVGVIVSSGQVVKSPDVAGLAAGIVAKYES